MLNNWRKVLSWQEPKEITNLDTALVSLGLTYYKGEVPGIKGEVYIINKYPTLKSGEVFAIKEDKFYPGEEDYYYRLYKITANWKDNFNLNGVKKGLIQALDFYGSV